MKTKGIRAYEMKERKAVRLRNHIAKDLGSPKYRQKIKEVKRHKLIDELRERELDEELEEYIEDYDGQDH